MSTRSNEVATKSEQKTQSAPAPARARSRTKEPAEPTARPKPEAEKAPAKPVAEGSEVDLDSPDLYLNRELTWLSFNRRVLNEAADERTPLLERVKFIAIVSNNLDEFFMKRIGGLKQQVAAGVSKPTVDGRSPAQQIVECHAVIRDIQAQQERILTEICHRLNEHGIEVKKYEELSEEQRNTLREQFIENIFPLLTPLAMDPGHPFPFISNLSLNLLVTMRYPAGVHPHMARVKVPVSKDLIPRYLRVGNDNTFVTLEDVITHNLDCLFPGMVIESCELFRVTRNANVELNEEEQDDLLDMIETELQERHFAPIVRLEVKRGMNPTHRGMLAAELELDEEADVFEMDGMLAMRDLFEIASLEIPELHETPHKAIDHARLAHDSRNIAYIVRDGGPMLLHHPYESFSTSVERFLRTASEDPKVLAIKMTLYRTSAQGNVIDSLVNAARNGKQVAVLVELKARFDEAANIRWARRLEEEGIHVTYGVVGLKTHSKVILVVRQDYDGIRRYAHVGTGNYHPGTARLYTDLGMITGDDAIGRDLTELFNYLTGYSPPPSYRKILAAPYTLKQGLLEKINREIAVHRESKAGHIQFKMNALEDADVTKALYRAAREGVKVDLIVRDTCRFRPGMPGVSETARVISIVGRFLEHARIFYFHNGGEEEYYIGSADLMKRNLESRVEVVAPVEDPDLREDLRMILNVQLSDKRSAWDMQPDGTYLQRRPSSEAESQSCQETLIQVAEKSLAAAVKHKQKRLRKKLSSHFDRRASRSSLVR